jgi:hypothetical protein
VSGAVADSFALMHEAVPWVRLPCPNSGFRPEGGGEDEAGGWAYGVTSFPLYVRQLVAVGKERLRHRSGQVEGRALPLSKTRQASPRRLRLLETVVRSSYGRNGRLLFLS